MKDDTALKTPLNGEALGFLLSWVFDVHENSRPITVQEKCLSVAARVIDESLIALTTREQQVVRMRVGLRDSAAPSTQQSIAEYFGISRHKVRAIQEEARYKLRNSSNALKALLDSPADLDSLLNTHSSSRHVAELYPVIETIRKLEPSLIAHLKKQTADLEKVHPEVFEHLIGEFLAFEGFTDVRLVGRNRATSADIYAALFIPFNIAIRVFVEVKRWKANVGIEVINQVLGAFLGEKDKLGWNAAMIVTIGGFSHLEKWSREELRVKGLILKDREDLMCYLEGYRQNEAGLWLQNPRTDLEDLS